VIRTNSSDEPASDSATGTPIHQQQEHRCEEKGDRVAVHRQRDRATVQR
jgi:hypothetical protein